MLRGGRVWRSGPWRATASGRARSSGCFRLLTAIANRCRMARVCPLSRRVSVTLDRLVRYFAVLTQHAAMEQTAALRGIAAEYQPIIEELYREIRALRIYEGTTEIQQLIIGKEWGLSLNENPLQGAFVVDELPTTVQLTTRGLPRSSTSSAGQRTRSEAQSGHGPRWLPSSAPPGSRIRW